MQAAARTNLKRVTSSSAANPPTSSSADSNLEQAVNGSTPPSLNQGQCCLRRQPPLRRGKDSMMSSSMPMIKKVKKVKVGDPFDPKKWPGPAGQPGTVRPHHVLHQGRQDQGAQSSLTGGGRDRQTGLLHRATVFGDVTDDM